MHTVPCALLRKPYLIKHKEVKGKPKKESVVENKGEVLASCGNTWHCNDCLACQVEGLGPEALRKGQSYGVAPGLTLTATHVIEGDGLAVEGGHLCKKLCKGTRV